MVRATSKVLPKVFLQHSREPGPTVRIEIRDGRLVREILAAHKRLLKHNPPTVKPTLNEFLDLALKLGLREFERRRLHL